MSWARKRQLMYLSIIFGIFAVFILSFYFIYQPVPSCFDGKKNQTELGIDCGGSCVKACTSQLVPLTIWWTRVFPVSKGIYDVANLVENQNISFGVPKIKYVLRVYDKFNILIAERTGETFFNPQEKFVIYEPNIDTKEQIADKAFLYFDDQAVWQKIKVNLPTISIGAKNYSNSPLSRLQSSVTNNSLDTLRGTKFVAVLSDQDGNALAASQTVIDVLAGNESKELNFTWSTPLVKDPAIIDIYPKISLDINTSESR
jgi:hypothetical protein